MCIYLQYNLPIYIQLQFAPIYFLLLLLLPCILRLKPKTKKMPAPEPEPVCLQPTNKKCARVSLSLLLLFFGSNSALATSCYWYVCKCFWKKKGMKRESDYYYLCITTKPQPNTKPTRKAWRKPIPSGFPHLLNYHIIVIIYIYIAYELPFSSFKHKSNLYTCLYIIIYMCMLYIYVIKLQIGTTERIDNQHKRYVSPRNHIAQ